MKISVLCTDALHPVVIRLSLWVADMRGQGHSVSLFHQCSELTFGDILFLVSCSELISEDVRTKYKATLVLHASDLPQGRGWSPHIWSILGGANEITVSVLEAKDPVDSGPIWFKKKFKLQGHELLDEINKKLFDVEIDLMNQVVNHFTEVTPQAQPEGAGSYFPKRTPENSRLDPNRTIGEQFDLMRVADAERYPNFFEFRGKKYRLRIEKVDHVE